MDQNGSGFNQIILDLFTNRKETEVLNIFLKRGAFFELSLSQISLTHKGFHDVLVYTEGASKIYIDVGSIITIERFLYGERPKNCFRP